MLQLPTDLKWDEYRFEPRALAWLDGESRFWGRVSCNPLQKCFSPIWHRYRGRDGVVCQERQRVQKVGQGTLQNR